MIEIDHGRYHAEGFSLAIDLNMGAGEFCAVLGPSGAGKTTLLSIIAGFEKLKSGTLKLNNLDVSANPSLRPVSMIFQDHNVFAHLDVWSNIALGISPSFNLNESQKLAVTSAIERVGLQKLVQRKPAELSGGERQRIALARVLVRDKPILLLDEPFAALDPALRRDMLNLVCELQKESRLTVLLVTHNPDEIELIAEKIAFVAQNRLAGAIPTRSFFQSTDPQIKRYLGR